MRLTDGMIRVTTSAFGTRGPIRERKLVVYINGTITLKDKRGNQRRFARRASAYGAAREYIAEHNQRELELCPCAASMGCLCVCHAAGMDASEPCDTSEERARRIAAGTDLKP